MLWRERRRRLASARANLAFSKEERDFASSGFYRIGTMGAVLSEAISVVSAQGTGQGVRRVGGAQQVTVTLNCIFAFQDGNHDRAGGHEFNQAIEERTTFVLSIETASLLNGQMQHFGADDFEPLQLQSEKRCCQ